MPRFKLFLSPQNFYKSYVNPLGEARGDYPSSHRDRPWDPLETLMDPSTRSSNAPATASSGFSRFAHCGGAVPGVHVEQPILVIKPKKVEAISNQQQQQVPVAASVQPRDNAVEFSTGPGSYLPYPFGGLELHTVREESESGSTSQSARSSRADQDVRIWGRSHSGGRGLSIGASPSHHLHLWEDLETDADPAPPWSDLSNRNLMCKSLPFNVGRCQCYILRETRDGRDRCCVYSLHTNEGHGRLDRKLAIARHRFKGGRSEFAIAQSGVGSLRHQLEEGYIGSVTANFAGTRYRIWDQGQSSGNHIKDTRMLLGVVVFEPSVTSVTGKYQSMRAFIPKYHSMQLGNSGPKIGLSENYEEDTNSVYRFRSGAAYPKKELVGKERDIREKLLKTGAKIKSSAKNIRLTLEGNGQQTILLFGRTSKTTYIMEYRYPLTAQQAFGICLASLDSKPYWRLVCI